VSIVHNKKADYDVYIGRPSKFGNPWVIGKDGTREEVIAKYAEWLPTQSHLMRSLYELDNKVLGCWCDYPNEDCHGRILLEARKKQIMEETQKKIKLAVVGSRTFDDKERLFKLLDKNRDRIEMIVSGGARGADDMAREWAEERGFPCLIFYARWNDESGEFDRGAGFKRNWSICRAADEVLAFWDGKSRGTAHNFEICETLGKKITTLKFVPKPKPEPVEQPQSVPVIAGEAPKKRGRPKKTAPEQAVSKPVSQAISVAVDPTKKESSVEI
jgi:hypothetical protein